MIRRGGVERPTELRVGDLRLEPATRRAWRGETELALSAKEFALLELLLRYPDEVLTRTRILEHVWDFAYDGASNVVDQYVLYLRRKVDRPFGVAQLETVRGVGYRLRSVPVPASGS
jgi:two-component system OmpR family response regulator